VCVCVYIHTHIHIHTYTHTYINTCIHTYIHIYIYIYIYLCREFVLSELQKYNLNTEWPKEMYTHFDMKNITL